MTFDELLQVTNENYEEAGWLCGRCTYFGEERALKDYRENIKRLERFRKDFEKAVSLVESGAKAYPAEVWLDAMYACAFFCFPLPSWMRDWYKESYSNYRTYETECDPKTPLFVEAFKPDPTHNSHKRQKQKKSRDEWPIYYEVEKANKSESKGPALFEGVAKKFSVSESTARNRYYEIKNSRKPRSS